MFTDNKEDGESIVATSDMCLYCFDTLMKELLPKSQSYGDSVYMDIRKQLENQQSMYTPPAVDCPLFVTWSKYTNKYPPPPIINVDNVAQKSPSSSGLVTPATTTTTTTSESNITDFSTTDTDNEEDRTATRRLR